MNEAIPETPNAAQAFSGLFGFIGWLIDWAKKHGIAVLFTTSILGGGSIWVNKCTGNRPAGVEEADAGLSNDVKMIELLRGFDSSLKVIAPAVANVQVRQSMQQTQLDNMTADLMQIPEIRRIEKRRHDTGWIPFTFNMPK